MGEMWSVVIPYVGKESSPGFDGKPARVIFIFIVRSGSLTVDDTSSHHDNERNNDRVTP